MQLGWARQCQQVALIFQLPLCNSDFWEFQLRCEQSRDALRKYSTCSLVASEEWGLLKHVTCNDLNLAEAYLALFLRTYSRPLFGNLSLWDISLPRVGKRISLALKTTFKKLDGNAACNLETWEIICKFHFYKSNWHSFSFSAIGPNDPLPGKNIIFLAAIPVPVPSLLKTYEAFKKGKSSSANQRTDYCSEVGWQVSLQINILPMHIYGLESQVLTL